MILSIPGDELCGHSPCLRRVQYRVTPESRRRPGGATVPVPESPSSSTDRGPLRSLYTHVVLGGKPASDRYNRTIPPQITSLRSSRGCLAPQYQVQGGTHSGVQAEFRRTFEPTPSRAMMRLSRRGLTNLRTRMASNEQGSYCGLIGLPVVAWGWRAWAGFRPRTAHTRTPPRSFPKITTCTPCD